jgi:hypothetical protein
MRTAILNAPAHRDYAKRLIDAAPDGAVVTVSEPRRNADQNAKMWAMLEDVARAKIDGRNWTRETWKAAFMHLLGHQVQFAEGLDGTGAFPVGFRTSRLTKGQMTDLITLIQEWGDRHGVQWRDFGA